MLNALLVILLSTAVISSFPVHHAHRPYSLFSHPQQCMIPPHNNTQISCFIPLYLRTPSNFLNSHNHSIHNTIQSFFHHRHTHQHTSYHSFPSYTSTLWVDKMSWLSLLGGKRTIGSARRSCMCLRTTLDRD